MDGSTQQVEMPMLKRQMATKQPEVFTLERNELDETNLIIPADDDYNALLSGDQNVLPLGDITPIKRAPTASSTIKYLSSVSGRRGDCSVTDTITLNQALFCSLYFLFISLLIEYFRVPPLIARKLFE